ncbi:MAG: hypothetical protein IJL17_18645 [Kiritimatiellae bacterium]|nr:hypothetical protein [Kiritimatiellia bacterium]
MTFTVTYREKDGTRAEIEIEAANRAACLSECKARGITPMGVREGRNRGATGHSPKQRLFTHHFLLFVAIAVVMAIALWWWLGSRGTTTSTASPAEKPTKPATAKPNLEPKPAPKKPSSPSPVEAVTNAPTVVTNAPMTRRERLIAKYGKEPITVRPGGKYKNGERLPEKRSLFKFASEKEIDRIISAEPGHRIIGRFPKGFLERDFRKSLEAKIEFTEEDTEEDIARKKRMIDVKEQLRQALDRGEKFDEIMEEARSEVNALADFRDNMIKNLVQLKKSGASEQEIEDYYSAANKMLGEKRIKPLLTPFQIREKVEKLRQMREKNSEETTK